MEYVEARRGNSRWRIGLLIALGAFLIGGRWFATQVIEFEWWREMGQLQTWVSLLAYGTAPIVLAAVAFFVAFWVAHMRALRHAGTSFRERPIYAKLSAAGTLLFASLVAALTVDSWTVVRFFGGFGAAGEWHDPVFARPLSFYFFQLPFYVLLLRVALVGAALSVMIYWFASRIFALRNRTPDWSTGGVVIDLQDFAPGEVTGSRFFRIVASLFLAALAVYFFLARYRLLLADHGSLVGVDWVDENVALPLLWTLTAASLLAIGAVWARRLRLLLALPLLMVAQAVVPRIVHAVYVRPSEITIQKPYIKRHIEATRAAYGLTARATEVDFAARIEAPIDLARHKPLLDNARLWDWRAFHDTVTQIQALRPYYVFHDSDVDPYQIDGQLRQVLLTPRELDERQLPADARQRWINPHFIYTHGYGLVVAEANRITAEGLPVLLVQNAPPEIKSKDFRITRPEIYYGEVTHEPVFVHTAQPEFDYPSGAGNVETSYKGKGGFPISSPWLRLAAAAAYSDWNILLTSYLKDESRMMIRRRVADRLEALAGFLTWDPDPYLVIGADGRLVWMVDGYTTSAAHPYSYGFDLAQTGRVNYIRNSVKATVDAYDGSVRLYVFDEADPLLNAYRRLFPALFTPVAEMPADLRAHARYPELIFRLQAEAYRTFHMRDPEAFFNKEDMWDLARNTNNASGRPEPVTPTYVVATLPDSDEPEFLLMTSFTPRGKDNLIGVMLARCDGPHLGELVFLQLSKQELVFGPMQVAARINQDQVISKDLTLWNQQGSRVLRGQMLVLPVEKTLLYIEPIYIQASEARMPQLKKVVIAMGNRIIYADSFERAVEELTLTTRAPAAAARGAKPETAAAAPPGDGRLGELRLHWQRYRELSGQGRHAEAGKELDAIGALLGARN